MFIMDTLSRRCLSDLHIILGFLLIALTLLVDALRCFDCPNAKLFCGTEGAFCTHDCNYRVECPDRSVCLAAIFSVEHDEFALLGCFPKYDHVSDYCYMFDNSTCSCESNDCTRRFIKDLSFSPEDFTEGASIFTEGASNFTNGSQTVIPVLTREARLQPPPIPPRQTSSTSGKANVKGSSFESWSQTPLTLTVVLFSCVMCIATVGSMFIAIKRKRRLNDTTPRTSDTDLNTEGSVTKGLSDTPPDSPIMSDNEQLNLNLQVVVGRGRFGAVWKAYCKSERYTERTVAVKVFYEFDSTSWNVEKELFCDPSVDLRHENIVNFFKTEVRQITYPQPQRQYWLITEYYERGSLQDYISHQTVNWEEFCRLAWSAARGVAHLHSDIKVDHGSVVPKYPVAHRDLKSSNILVKQNGTCAIADFGLAIKLDPRATVHELANSGQVGSPRYMPPEALECKINLQEIESFKQIDVYSLALVIWEIGKRCDVIPDVPDYELPFTKQLNGRRPSLDEMRAMVAHRKERPSFPDSWSTVTGMSIVKGTIKECWDEEPEARLTASCVETRLQTLTTWTDGESTPNGNDFSYVTMV